MKHCAHCEYWGVGVYVCICVLKNVCLACCNWRSIYICDYGHSYELNLRDSAYDSTCLEHRNCPCSHVSLATILSVESTLIIYLQQRTRTRSHGHTETRTTLDLLCRLLWQRRLSSVCKCYSVSNKLLQNTLYSDEHEVEPGIMSGYSYEESTFALTWGVQNPLAKWKINTEYCKSLRGWAPGILIDGKCTMISGWSM